MTSPFCLPPEFRITHFIWCFCGVVAGLLFLAFLAFLWICAACTTPARPPEIKEEDL